MRDQWFVNEVVKRGIPVTSKEKLAIAETVYPTMENWRDKRKVVRKVNQKLRQPDIREALSAAFEVATETADMPGITRAEVLGILGKKVRSGEDAALFFVLKNFFPSPGTQVNVNQRSVSVNVSASASEAQNVLRNGPPPTRSRSIGSGSAISLGECD